MDREEETRKNKLNKETGPVSMDTETEQKYSVDWRGRPCKPNKHGGMTAAIFVLCLQAFEMMAIAAVGNNLITYVFNEMHFPLSKSANIVTNFIGTVFLLSLFGGFLSDSYLGSFWTMLIFGFVELSGFILLAVQAHIPQLRPPKCDMMFSKGQCLEAKGYKAMIFYVALYLVALGSGSLKPNIISHGADQFKRDDSKQSKKLSSFFNCAYFAFCTGELIALTLLVWMQTHYGMDVGFGVSAAAMAVGLISLLCGTVLYRNTPPRGSIFTPIAQALRKAIPLQCEIKGECNIGYLDYRHILIRVTLLEDYIHLLSRPVFWMKTNRASVPMRTMKWDKNFDPNAETSIAVAWISFPNLAPQFFVKEAIFSLAQAVGKPLKLDAATTNNTRPSCAKVKVEVDLVRDLPQRVRLGDREVSTGEVRFKWIKVRYDFLPKYCKECQMQGHSDEDCRVLHPNKALPNTENHEKESPITVSARQHGGNTHVDGANKKQDGVLKPNNTTSVWKPVQDRRNMAKTSGCHTNNDIKLAKSGTNGLEMRNSFHAFSEDDQDDGNADSRDMTARDGQLAHNVQTHKGVMTATEKDCNKNMDFNTFEAKHAQQDMEDMEEDQLTITFPINGDKESRESTDKPLTTAVQQLNNNSLEAFQDVCNKNKPSVPNVPDSHAFNSTKEWVTAAFPNKIMERNQLSPIMDSNSGQPTQLIDQAGDTSEDQQSMDTKMHSSNFGLVGDWVPNGQEIDEKDRQNVESNSTNQSEEHETQSGGSSMQTSPSHSSYVLVSPQEFEVMFKLDRLMKLHGTSDITVEIAKNLSNEEYQIIQKRDEDGTLSSILAYIRKGLIDPPEELPQNKATEPTNPMRVQPTRSSNSTRRK